MISHARRLVSTSLLALLCCGCGGPAYVAGTPVVRPNRAAQRMAEVETLYPTRFRATQRGVLTTPNRAMALTGVVVAEADTLKLAALSDFGKIVFILMDAPGEPPTIDQALPGIPKSHLAALAGRDLRVMFRPPSHPILRQERTAERWFRVVTGDADGMLWVYDFDEHLVRLQRVRRGRVTYEARFDDWTTDFDPQRPLPRLVRIRDYRYRYQLEVRLGEFAVGPATPTTAP